MDPDATDSIENLPASDLIRLMSDLVGVVGVLRAENETLKVALAKLRAEHLIVTDELARLKNLPPRPPIKASGMDKATQRGGGPGTDGKKGPRSTRRRGSQLDKLTIGQTIVVKAKAPDGTRHKGYEDIVVQDLSLSPTATLYRRERWETPDGAAIVADLAPGIVGGYGPHLHRLISMLNTQGQMTCERILALLNDIGVVISKRQVVRLLTTKLEIFRDEDEAVLKAGLVGDYVMVDDTGARHAVKNGYATQIGSDRFCVFRSGPGKSRLAFLSRLSGGASLHVINHAALEYMEERALPRIVIDKFRVFKNRIFASREEWESCLNGLGLGEMNARARYRRLRAAWLKRPLRLR